jgi:uncharacterized protein Yka (UPF0111/DUF47 family)
MIKSLLPREYGFFDLFEQAASLIVDGAKALDAMLRDLENADVHARKVKDIEHACDKVTHTTLELLHKTFITPLDREDIHMIVINVDKSLDILNSIARKFQIYGVKKVPVNVCRFADIIVEISTEMKNLFIALEKKDNINDIVRRMHELENKADTLFYNSVAELFSDGKYSPVEIIKYKEIYEHLESIVDSVDFIGKIIRGIAVKQG